MLDYFFPYKLSTFHLEINTVGFFFGGEGISLRMKHKFRWFAKDKTCYVWLKFKLAL